MGPKAGKDPETVSVCRTSCSAFQALWLSRMEQENGCWGKESIDSTRQPSTPQPVSTLPPCSLLRDPNPRGSHHKLLCSLESVWVKLEGNTGQDQKEGRGWGEGISLVIFCLFLWFLSWEFALACWWPFVEGAWFFQGPTLFFHFLPLFLSV